MYKVIVLVLSLCFREVNAAKRKPGRPRKNWMDTICQDVKGMELSWEWNWGGKKFNSFLSTEKNGIKVWRPNMSSTQCELRFKVQRFQSIAPHSLKFYSSAHFVVHNCWSCMHGLICADIIALVLPSQYLAPVTASLQTSTARRSSFVQMPAEDASLQAVLLHWSTHSTPALIYVSLTIIHHVQKKGANLFSAMTLAFFGRFLKIIFAPMETGQLFLCYF